MTPVESTLYDLEEDLVRNDDMADDGTYITIVGIANDVAKLESENAKLRELMWKTWKWEKNGCYECPMERDCKVLCVYDGDCGMAVEIEGAMHELGIET